MRLIVYVVNMVSCELTIADVAALFRVKKWTVYNWVKQGKIGSIRYSDRRQFIPQYEIVRFYHDKNCNFDLQHRLQEVIG